MTTTVAAAVPPIAKRGIYLIMLVGPVTKGVAPINEVKIVKVDGTIVSPEFSDLLDRIHGTRADRWRTLGPLPGNPPGPLPGNPPGPEDNDLERWQRQMSDLGHFITACYDPLKQVPVEALCPRQRTFKGAGPTLANDARFLFRYALCKPHHHLGDFYDSETEVLLGKKCFVHILYLFSSATAPIKSPTSFP